jgi:hypothetical protein
MKSNIFKGVHVVSLLNSSLVVSSFVLSVLEVHYIVIVNTLNSGAGIKLVLHGQDEIPIPAEYGQELPTGREGFINVEMSKVCKYIFSRYAKYLYNTDKYLTNKNGIVYLFNSISINYKFYFCIKFIIIVSNNSSIYKQSSTKYPTHKTTD